MRRRNLIAALGVLAAVAGAGMGRAAPEAGRGAAPPSLAFPLACQPGRTCEVQNQVDRDAGPGVLDYRCGRHTYDGHTGTDIRVLDLAMQKAGVAVLAAAPGKVLRLRDGVPDVLITDRNAPRDESVGCGNAVVLDHGGGWITAYCHMARGSVRVKAGEAVAAGQPIGKVGLSGDTEFPHLHIEVRHDGQVVDPFGPAPVQAGACPAQKPLWNAAAQRQLAYRRGAILNAGLAGAALDAPGVETGPPPPVTAASSAIIAYVRAINLEPGDVIDLSLVSPDGRKVANALPPLAKPQAQYFYMVGRKRPPGGWPQGRYAGEIRVRRGDKVVLERHVEAKL